MQNRAFALRASTAMAVVSLVAAPLAGCSGSSSAIPGVPGSPASASGSPASVHMNVPPAADSMGSAAEQPDKKKKKSTLLFVSDNENNKFSVYNAAGKAQNPAPLRTITSGISAPNGIATDKSGNLYVANSFAGTVTVYGPNSSTPKTTIANGLNDPFDVKVDGFGNIYVANDPFYGTAYIAEYPAGSSSPSTTWSVPQQGMTISGIALLNPTMQGETSIYALAYTENPSTGATGYGLSCYPGNGTCVSMGETFGQTGGIEIAQSPVAGKTFQWLAVDQYVPGVDIFTQSKPMGQLVTGGTPEFLTLNAAGNRLFVVDRFYGNADEYSYPAGKKLNAFAGGAQPYGVAVYPSGTMH
jgi:hypothetical protein